jgi:hypothetical protein
MRQFSVGFGTIHSRVSPRIQHPVGPVLKHGRPAGFPIAKIESGHSLSPLATGGDQLQRLILNDLMEGTPQHLTQLACGARQQHFHPDLLIASSPKHLASRRKLCQTWRCRILIRQQGPAQADPLQGPGDVETGISPKQAPFARTTPKPTGLVLHLSPVAEGEKPMGKPHWHPQLLLIR